MTTSDQHDATELQQHPIRRFGVHALMTTGSIMTLLAMLPSGFAGVPFMVMVSAVFVALFMFVAIRERSRLLNLATVAFFWASVSVIHVTNLGTAPMQFKRLLDGLLFIGAFAAIHAILQLVVHFVFRRSRVADHRTIHHDSLANKAMHPRGEVGRFGSG